MFILKGHNQPVQRLEFSGDGKTLLAVDSHHNVRLWDLGTRTTRWTLDSTYYDYIVSVTFTADCRHVLTYVWRRPAINAQSRPKSPLDHSTPFLLHDVETGMVSPASIQHVSGSSFTHLTFSPDGARCVAQNKHWTSEHLWWEYPSGVALPAWRLQAHNKLGFGAVAFSPDGRTLAGIEHRGVHFFDVSSGQHRFLHPFRLTQTEYHLAFHPNGKYLAIGSGPRLVILDIDSRQEIAELRLDKKFFLDAAFTRDGRYLATVSNEETVKFWDTSSWRVTQEYAWEVGGLRCIAFDRDGFRAAAAGTGKKIVVWDLDE